MAKNRDPFGFVIGIVIAFPIGLILSSYAFKAAVFYGGLVGNLPAFIATCLLASWLDRVIRRSDIKHEILYCAILAGFISMILATIFGLQSLVEDPGRTIVTMGALLMLVLLSRFFRSFTRAK